MKGPAPSAVNGCVPIDHERDEGVIRKQERSRGERGFGVLWQRLEIAFVADAKMAFRTRRVFQPTS